MDSNGEIVLVKAFSVENILTDKFGETKSSLILGISLASPRKLFRKPANLF